MKYTLVMDTCGGQGYVALCGEPSPVMEPLAERFLAARGTQERLLPAIHEVLAEAGIALSSLAAVVAVSGPGSFTGVRIGLATAKGLCEAQDLHLVTLSRLTVLARAAQQQSAPPGKSIWALLDAGRAEVYSGVLQAGEQTIQNEVLLPASEALLRIGSGTAAVYEQGLLEKFPGAALVEAAGFYAALRLAAVAAVEAECWADAVLSDAHYLRVPDAELALRARQS